MVYKNPRFSSCNNQIIEFSRRISWNQCEVEMKFAIVLILCVVALGVHSVRTPLLNPGGPFMSGNIIQAAYAKNNNILAHIFEEAIFSYHEQNLGYGVST